MLGSIYCTVHMITVLSAILSFVSTDIDYFLNQHVYIEHSVALTFNHCTVTALCN